MHKLAFTAEMLDILKVVEYLKSFSEFQVITICNDSQARIKAIESTYIEIHIGKSFIMLLGNC